MSFDVESRGRRRFFRASIRGLLSSTLQGGDSNHEDEQVVPISASTPGHGIFQDARNTSIHNSTFNIYASGSSIAPASSSPGSSSPSQSSTGGSSSSLGAQSQPGIPLTDIGFPPCINEPFPAPQTSPEIYVHHLMRQNRGYPLWIPSPSMSLPVSYRSAGVMLGDVGIITPEGGFSFFFNALYESTHPVNAEMLLPDHFVPYVPRGRTGALVHTESSAMTSLTSDKFMIRSFEDGKTVLSTSVKETAVLMMPEPVYLSRLHDINRFRMYVKEHLENWYRYIRAELGWDVENGGLRVVYGCRKTAGFGIATITNARPDSSTELTFLIDETWTECKYRWHHRGSAEVKAGPLAADNVDIRESEPSGGAPVNQCLFLNTIDFTLSDDQWARFDSYDCVALSAHTSTTHLTPAKSLLSHNERHTGDLSSSTDSDGQYALHSDSVRRADLMPSPLLKKLFHPSDVLGKFLLSKVANAKSVAICFDDWGPFLTEDVNDTTSLIRSVLQANDVFEEDGMVYLKTRRPFTTTSSTVFSREYAYFMELLEADLSGAPVNLSNLETDTRIYHGKIPSSRANHSDVLPSPNRADVGIALDPSSASMSTCVPVNQEMSSIVIGIFDPHQHVNNQVTVRVTIGDNGRFMSEINRSNNSAPTYVLIVDGVNEDGVVLNLGLFNVETRENVLDSLTTLCTSWCPSIDKPLTLDADSSPLITNNTQVITPTALRSLSLLAAQLCRSALWSAGLKPITVVISQTLPTSLWGPVNRPVSRGQVCLETTVPDDITQDRTGFVQDSFEDPIEDDTSNNGTTVANNPDTDGDSLEQLQLDGVSTWSTTTLDELHLVSQGGSTALSDTQTLVKSMLPSSTASSGSLWKARIKPHLSVLVSSVLKFGLPLVEQLAASPPPKRKALLVGLDGEYSIVSDDEAEYADNERNGAPLDADMAFNTRGKRERNPTSLKGPRTDVDRLKDLLIEKYMYNETDIVILVDDGVDGHTQPTKENILAAIDLLVEGAQPPDRFVFAFAGHGFQKEAGPDDEEEDDLNEFITTSCGKGIKDNVLYERLVKPLPKGCKLTAIFDSRHSATMLDLKHNKCNRVYLPWLDKGKQRTQTLQYQARREVALMPSPANSLEGLLVTSRESSLRAHTFNNNIRRNSSDTQSQNVDSMPAGPTRPGTPPHSARTASPVFVRNPRRRSRAKPENLAWIETTMSKRRSRSPRRRGVIYRSPSPSPTRRRAAPSRIIESEGDLVESPVSRFCDGNCRDRQDVMVEDELPLADVICLSSSQDNEITWEDMKGRSMIKHLADLLDKNPNPILETLMKEISHTIYNSNDQIHALAREFRKERAFSSLRKGKERTRVYGPDNRRLSELEMTNFQRPELSSLVPLDMENTEWDM